jgi:hypothetical protein
VLEWLGFEHSSISAKLASQARILLLYYWTCYTILKAGGPRFQAMSMEASGKKEQQGRPAALPYEQELRVMQHGEGEGGLEQQEAGVAAGALY